MHRDGPDGVIDAPDTTTAGSSPTSTAAPTTAAPATTPTSRSPAAVPSDEDRPAVSPTHWIQVAGGFVTAGLAADQARFGIGLAGGDSVSTTGPVTLSLTAFGLVPRGQALPRKAARTDDCLFVTGSIGDAALGLEVALGTLTEYRPPVYTAADLAAMFAPVTDTISPA